jgi:CRP-like cAMP-binding protein
MKPSSPAVTAAEFSRLFPSLVADMGVRDIEPLLAAMSVTTVKTGEQIIAYRGRSSRLYFVRQGRLRVWVNADHRPVVLGEIGPGKWVGEVTVLDGGPATATVAAVEECTLLVLSREAFDNLREQHARIAARLVLALCRDLANRLRRAQLDLGNGESGWVSSAGQLIGAEER